MHQLFKADFSAVHSKNTVDLHRQIEGTTKLGLNPAMGQNNKSCHNFTLFQTFTMGLLKCLCIQIFDNFFIGSKTEKQALYRLLMSVPVPEI